MNTLKCPDHIFKGILIVQIILMIDVIFFVFHLQSSQLLSFVRYMMFFVGFCYVIMGVKSKHVNIPLFYMLFIIWVIYLLITAVPEIVDPTDNYIKFKRFNSGLLFTYSLPFLICADLDTSFFRSLIRLSYFMTLVYVVLAIPSYFIGEASLVSYMSEAIIFLVSGSILFLMTLPYQREKKVILTIIAVAMAIIIMMLLSRRNKVVYLGGGLGFAIILNVLKGQLGVMKKVLIIVLTVAGLIFIFNSKELFGDFFYKMGTGFDSRESILELYIADFNRTPRDWIFGRGLYGDFYVGNYNINQDNWTGYRDGIENGYLMLILKGGGIWLGFLICISLVSVYKGLFKSNNIFVKGCACFILLYYLDMVGFGVPGPELKYIMVFLSISVCSSAKWREYTDDDIKDTLAI